MTKPRSSAQSVVLSKVIGATGWKRRFSSARSTSDRIDELAVRPAAFGPPPHLERTVAIRASRFNGWPVYTVDPLDGPTGGHAIYAHGGSWMNTITSQHWRLIAELASRTGTRFTVPIYPLVPFGTADAVVPVFADLAAAAVRDSGSGRTTLMGDSAGGTIALAAALHLRDKGLAGPAHVVLISPALDLGFSDPAIERIQPTDPWLAVPGLRVAADRWRGDRSIDDPLVSPIHGTLSGIGRIALFSGSHDILHADAQALLRRAGAEGHPIDFHDAPGMLHVYPLLPVPEGRAARTAIAAVLKGAHDSA